MFAREDAWVLDNTNVLGGLNYPNFLDPLGIPEGDCPKLLSIRGPIFGFLL